MHQSPQSNLCACLWRLASVLIALFVGTGVLAAEPVQANTSKVGEATLDNGLKIVVIPDHRLPVVTHMVWYKVGAADEQAGASGLAHFVEHLMFRSCNVFGNEGFAQIISRLGAIDNATTNHDATYYYQNVGKQHLGRVMQLESARMAKLPASESDIPPERNVILEERRSKIDTNPIRLLNENILSALYRNHRYGIPSIGWPHEMAKLDYDMAVAFHARYYAPNNAILVVAGDITLTEVLGLAQATYGKIPRRTIVESRTRPKEPDQSAALRVELDDKRIQRPTLFRYYLTSSAVTAEPGEAEALELSMTILGGHEAARLQTELIGSSRLASSTGSRFYGNIRDSGRIVLFAVPDAGQAPEIVESRLNAVVAKFVREGITDEELRRAKSTLEAEYIFMSDSRMARAMRYGEALSHGRTVADVDGWLERMMKTTVAAANSAARKYLDKRHSATGVVMKTVEERAQ